MALIIVLVFAAVFVLGLAVASLTSPRAVERRLASLADGTAAQIPDSSHEGSMLEREKQGWLRRLLSSVGDSSASKQSAQVGRLRQRMIYAGYRSESAPAIFLGTRIVLALALPAIFLSTPWAWTMEAWRLLPLLFVSSGVGYVLPSWWVDRRTKWRQSQIERGLPDALDLMVVCVEAGFGVNASLARIAQEFASDNPLLAAEMQLVTLEIRAGKPTVDALRGLAERTGVDDVSSLVSLLVQTNRFGTSVADALRVHADAMRVRRMQRAEEKAGQAPLKMIFPTVVIFLGTLIVLLTPAVIRFNGMFEK